MRTRLAVLTVLAAFAAPSIAAAHLERPSYWPDPAPDRSVSPPAGGEVPTARPLASAVSGAGPGEVRVVCKGRDGSKSLSSLDRSLDRATSRGFRLRPSQPKIVLSDKKAAKLVRINEALAERCEYRNIQEAVFDSGNNDRVVVLPGRYREKPSRRELTNDPRCAEMVQDNGSGGMAPSYEYQTTCPNDQNLIYVGGREVGKTPPPEPPLLEREGIPDLGACIRCNLQLEGSGVKPEDVTIDAGRNYARKGPEAKPGVANGCDFDPGCAYAKDVILRIDRADGFVGRNFLTRSSTEHGVYVEETDGYLLDKTKFYWNADYGNLTFTSDHGLYKNCDSFGAGDAAVYPGAAPETGVGVEDTEFYPDAPRINTVVKKCDLRSSALAYSGSQGNAVRITRNEIYANTAGVVSDSISAGGHPGYPPDSIEIDHNNIYANNLDSYDVENPPFLNLVGLPIGVGVVWPGVNKSSIHDNYIFDNWRRGTMQLAIPEAFIRGEAEDKTAAGSCPGNDQVPTSCDNEYYDNRMGVVPPGFKPSVAVNKFGNPSAVEEGDSEAPNGVDFWWDEFLGNTGNCWHDNVGFDGTRGTLTADPPVGPVEGSNLPGFLPEACGSSSVGLGDVVKEAVLINCGLGFSPGAEQPEGPTCDWFTKPPEPGSPGAARQQRSYDSAAARWRGSPEAEELRRRIAGIVAGTVEPPADFEPFETTIEGVGPVRVGSVAVMADCEDWRGGTRAQRLATLADIQEQVNQVGTEPTTDMDQDTAYDTLQRICSAPYARGFRLYKLYTRAAVFAALAG